MVAFPANTPPYRLTVPYPSTTSVAETVGSEPVAVFFLIVTLPLDSIT